MKTVVLKVSDGFITPNIISHMTIEGTESLLETISTLLISYKNNIDNITDDSILSELTALHNSKITKLKKQHDIQTKELENTLQTKLKSHDDKIINLTTLLEQTNQHHIEIMGKERAEFIEKLNQEREFITEITNSKLQAQTSEIDSLRKQIVDQRTFSYSEKQKELDDVKLNYSKQIDNINKELTKQIETNSTETASLEKQITTTITNQYEEKLQGQKELVIQLQSDITEQRATTTNFINTYKTLLKDKQIKNTDEKETIDKKLTELIKQIQPVIKYHTGTNEEKGSAGERTVMNLLRTDAKYESAKIYDTSGETASGDINICWKNLRCLIEVKNKKNITKEDLEKFTRDVNCCSMSEKDINCAIFISLQTNIFPGRNRETIQVDIVNNIPVIYTYLSDPNQLHYAMICLDNIVKNTVNDTDKVHKLLEYYQGYYNTVKRLYNYFNKLIKIKQTEIRSIQKELSNLSIIDDDLSQNISNFTYDPYNNNNSDDGSNYSDDESEQNRIQLPNTSPEQLDLDNVSESQNMIAEYYISLSLSKPTEKIDISTITMYFNISPHILLKKLGGFNLIISKAKKHYLLQNITPEIIKQLKAHKVSFNSYPKRDTLTKKYIPARTLSKLNQVIKVKKIMEYIYNFVEDYNLTEPVNIVVTPTTNTPTEPIKKPVVLKKIKKTIAK
jgi:hypothetical protein